MDDPAARDRCAHAAAGVRRCRRAHRWRHALVPALEDIMSLPVSTNRTIAAAQRVARADLLSIQDCQIARYQRGMRAQWTRTIPALLGRPAAAGQWPTIGAGLYLQ